MTDFYIAQCNISRLKAPLVSPVMKEFTDFLEPLNAFADQLDGFIWRLKGENGEASSNMKSGFEDEMMIINITVWRDVQSLKNFTFGTVHNYFLKNRNKWMDRVDKTQFVMWWIPVGHIPTEQEAIGKLEILEKHGALPNAFNWQTQFDPNGNLIEQS